jgi:hypothetical protein
MQKRFQQLTSHVSEQNMSCICDVGTQTVSGHLHVCVLANKPMESSHRRSLPARLSEPLPPIYLCPQVNQTTQSYLEAEATGDSVTCV